LTQLAHPINLDALTVVAGRAGLELTASG
jgi:hypothetical protein